MRKPYPFKVPVDLNADDVEIKILVDMPYPGNMSVHLANEHGANPDRWQDNYIAHLAAHLYGDFRDGSEHYHVRGETA
jgi:hypothetical protein